MGPTLGGAPASIPAREIASPSPQHKPVLTGLDWLRSKTFGLFQQNGNASRMQSASGLRDKRNQPTGEHGGYGLRPDAAAMQTVSTSRLIVGGVFASVT